MSIRVEVRLDQESESSRYIATATMNGNRLYEVGANTGNRDEVFRKLAGWLKRQGYYEPDHYWAQAFREGTARWVRQEYLRGS